MLIYILGVIICYIPFRILFPTRVIGRKNLVKGKCIIASNHTSNLDVVLIYLRIRKMYALAKKELFKGKFKTKLLTSLGGIPIERGRADITAIKSSIRVLNNNKTLLVFPTGTRTESAEDVQDLKKGIARFALQTDAPIVPMVLQKKPGLFRFNRLVIGEPIYMTEYLDRKKDPAVSDEIMERVKNEMENLLEYKKRK